MADGGRSNANGRSLECSIVESLSLVSGCTLTPAAVRAQRRDRPQLDGLDYRLRASFLQAATIAGQWITHRCGVGTGERFSVDRMSDGAPGVADLLVIPVLRPEARLALSVKHNNDALKHPRPYSLLSAIGMSGEQERDHRRRLAAADAQFRHGAGSSGTFKATPASVKRELYDEVCKACKVSIDGLSSSPEAVGALFGFLVAPGCMKLIVETAAGSRALERIAVEDWGTIPQPKTVASRVASSAGSAYLILTFDNGWELSLRIHNAATDFASTGQLKLKFDVRQLKGSLPKPTRLYPDGASRLGAAS